MRHALVACVVATLVIAGAGAANRAREHTTDTTTGANPVVTVLPAHGVAPASADPLTLAQTHLQRARATDDPREESYAEAALAPLFIGPDPPIAALFLRAVLAQRRHDFAAATRDLDSVLTREPKHADARLTLAFVQLAQNQAEAADHDCDALTDAASTYVVEACHAAVWTRLGRAREAVERLQHFTTGDSGLAAGELAWLFSLQAEAAEALGMVEAGPWFEKSLGLDPADRYTRATYTDYLLDQHRPVEALAIVNAAPQREESDALLLRRALAQHELKDPRSEDSARTLRARFDAMTERGDPLHLREEIRFRSVFDPSFGADRALDLAVRNYAIQKEPWDARVLFEACLRAGRPDPCREARNGYRTFEHPQLRALRDRLAP